MSTLSFRMFVLSEVIAGPGVGPGAVSLSGKSSDGTSDALGDNGDMYPDDWAMSSSLNIVMFVILIKRR